MIENFTSLRIRCGIFENETTLFFFPNQTIFSLVYGKNGSGKSTIARAFRNIVNDEFVQGVSSKMYDQDNSLITLTEEEKKSIHVFDEMFIEDNIRLVEDGLNTIIVMGKAKGVDDELKMIQPEYEKIVNDVKLQEIKVEAYGDENNIISPLYHENKIINLLKGDDNWAGRDRIISGSRRNTGVNNSTYKTFIDRHPSETRSNLITEFNKLIKRYSELEEGQIKINAIVPKFEVQFDKESEIIRLLGEKIERPNLSEREKMLFNILKYEDGNKRLLDIKTHFSSEKKSVCPFCFQTVATEYANGLVNSIEKILSKKVEEHQNNLGRLRLNLIEIDFSEFQDALPQQVKECEAQVKALNDIIVRVNEFINKKMENVYEPLFVNAFGLNERYAECQLAFSKLDKAKNEFNHNATDTNQIKKKLENINNDIAYYDIKEEYDEYIKQLKKQEYEQKLLDSLNQSKIDMEQKKNKLEQEKKNARIAMDKINDDLAYIFFSKTRLRIEYKNDKYLLYSHEKPVKPKDVSVGERNALALCYFFNCIMENKEENHIYNTNYLLVIDDPVSSFDRENRIGVLSYLKYELGEYFKGNIKSKFIIMTHDLQTCLDMKECIQSLLIGQNKKSYLQDIFELNNNAIKKFNIDKRNEYTFLLGIVFEYAKKIDSEYSFNIGNIMRKVMEAFCTFLYKKGMGAVFSDDTVMAKLVYKDRKYYGNLMYRLILNMDSHMENKVKSMNDMSFFSYISEEDKQQTARDIICLIYKLNPEHVISHLIEKGDVKDIIESWFH